MTYMPFLPFILIALYGAASAAMIVARSPRKQATAKWLVVAILIALPASHALGLGWPA